MLEAAESGKDRQHVRVRQLEGNPPNITNSSREKMNLDSRGVLRGSCTECACTYYNGGVEKKKCIKCSHPPGKHKNLSDGVGSVGSTSTSTGHYMGSYTAPHNMGGTLILRQR